MWTLWKYQPIKDYPSVWYFWIDPENIIQYSRSVESIGFAPIEIVLDLWNGKEVNLKVMRQMGCKKIKTKMSQEELSKGWLNR